MSRFPISSEKKVNGTTVLRTRQLFNDNDQLTHENWKMGTKTYYRVLTYNTSTDYSLATVSMPTNQTLTMGYDGLRRLKSVNGGLYNLSYTYRDRDATYTTTQVSRLGYTRSGATTLNFDYTYDTLGNIETYTAPSKSKITYTYDKQGQLTKAAGAKTYTYTYDNVGNILTASDGTTTHNYTYGDSDWHDKLMKFDGQSITYDASGNPTSYYNGTRWTFGWSNGRNLTSASGGGKTLSFTYDLQDGTRATKTVDGVVHNYIYAGGKLLRETYGNTTLDFIYDVNGRPYAMIVNESTTYYYITNLQGDVINVVNSSGTTVASYEYDPYGNPVVEDETSLGFTNPLRYRGYYWDSETQMYYLLSRYYDPAVGRFINADSYASTGQETIGYNMYAYCGNNPVNNADYNGKMSQLHTFDHNRPVGSQKYAEFAALSEAYNAQGTTLYPTEESALMAWRDTYLSLSEEYEYGSHLYSVDTALGTYFYTSKTYKGSKGWGIISPNVLGPVAILQANYLAKGGNLVALVHTHPNPGEKYHNDFPSYDSSIYGGDRIVFNLLGYSEMYVIPYKRCTNTPIIISIKDTSTWCNHYTPQ